MQNQVEVMDQAAVNSGIESALGTPAVRPSAPALPMAVAQKAGKGIVYVQPLCATGHSFSALKDMGKAKGLKGKELREWVNAEFFKDKPEREVLAAAAVTMFIQKGYTPDTAKMGKTSAQIRFVKPSVAKASAAEVKLADVLAMAKGLKPAEQQELLKGLDVPAKGGGEEGKTIDV